MTPKTMRSQLAGFAGDDDIAFHVCAPLIKLLSHWPLSSFTDTSVARLQGVPMVLPLLYRATCSVKAALVVAAMPWFRAADKALGR